MYIYISETDLIIDLIITAIPVLGFIPLIIVWIKDSKEDKLARKRYKEWLVKYENEQ